MNTKRATPLAIKIIAIIFYLMAIMTTILLIYLIIVGCSMVFERGAAHIGQYILGLIYITFNYFGLRYYIVGRGLWQMSKYAASDALNLCFKNGLIAFIFLILSVLPYYPFTKDPKTIISASSFTKSLAAVYLFVCIFVYEIIVYYFKDAIQHIKKEKQSKKYKSK